MTTIESILTFSHAVLLLAIFVVVFSYQPDSNTRKRRGVSLLAVAFAGTCFASAVTILSQLSNPAQACQPSQLWQALFTACVFVAVAHTRGNIAKLLPRLKWENRS